LENSPHQLIKSISFPLILKISAAFIGLLFNFIATHYISAQEFGAFSIAIVLILVMVTIAKFGLEHTLVKLSAIALSRKQHHIINTTYALSLIIAFCGAIFLGILLWLFGEWLVVNIFTHPDLLPLISLIIYITIPNVLIIINSGLLKGLKHPNSSILFSGLITLSITITLTLVLKPESSKELLEILCIANYLSCLFSFFPCIRYLKLKKNGIKFNRATLKSITKSCIPLWISSLVALLIQQFSILMLAQYASLAQIGIYAITAKIALTMTFILFAFNTVLAPKFAALYSSNKHKELNLLVKITNTILLVIAIIMACTLFFLATPLLTLFGEEYKQGALWLKILVLGQLVNVGTGSVVNLLIMTGHEVLHQRNTLIVAFITLIMAFVLIPTYGPLGAALTTALAMSTQNLISYYFAQQKILKRT
jgi:O-antigen/teichoic acid export membrane protein